MSCLISKEDLQLAEMLLNVIICEAERVTPANVAHHSNSIKCNARKVKTLLSQKPKYKCYRCKDKGVIVSSEFRGHTEGIVDTEIPCSCQEKK